MTRTLYRMRMLNGDEYAVLESPVELRARGDWVRIDIYIYKFHDTFRRHAYTKAGSMFIDPSKIVSFEVFEAEVFQ